MDNMYVEILILLVVLLGMSAIGKEIIEHYQKKNKLSKSELKWKSTLLMLGVYLAVIKILKIITIINANES